MSRSFVLLRVGGTGAFGAVEVVQRSGFFSATVVVHGTVNGTLDALHIHLGSCASPYGGMRLTMLGLLAGDAPRKAVDSPPRSLRFTYRAGTT